MASSEEKPSDHKEEKQGQKKEEKGGFLDKIKGFVQNIGEKLEETVGFGKPTADVSAIHIPCINLDKADIIVDVVVSNPNPIPIPLVDIKYVVESDGRKLVSGLIPDAGTVKAHGSETVQIPLSLVYKDIQDTYDDIKPGTIIPYRIGVDLIADVPVLGKLTLPLEKRGEIPVPYKPDVDVQKVEFDRFSFEECAATLKIKVENKNDFDLNLNLFEYEMWLVDVRIGEARISQTAKIDRNGAGYVELPISFRPKDFGSALWDMMRGKGAGYSMKGKLEVDTPFGPMHLPFNKEGGTTRLGKKNKDEGDDDDEVCSATSLRSAEPFLKTKFLEKNYPGLSTIRIVYF
eukprot:Gb_00016 [translate_table: standard]